MRAAGIWDTVGGRELRVLPDSRSARTKVTWSPAGRMIGVTGDSTRIFDATLGYRLAIGLVAERTNR
ncbi:MAG: hypothetical protein DVB31_10215 [Verrucomicrobia bacterium]|nr:MAG: hypothetical protein DVB31_10215 [Verrucomicrobiota bacterium]